MGATRAELETQITQVEIIFSGAPKDLKTNKIQKQFAELIELSRRSSNATLTDADKSKYTAMIDNLEDKPFVQKHEQLGTFLDYMTDVLLEISNRETIHYGGRHEAIRPGTAPPTIESDPISAPLSPVHSAVASAPSDKADPPVAKTEVVINPMQALHGFIADLHFKEEDKKSSARADCYHHLRVLLENEMKDIKADSATALYSTVKGIIDDLNQLDALCQGIEEKLSSNKHASNEAVIRVLQGIISSAYLRYQIAINPNNPAIPFNEREIVNNNVMRMEIFLDVYRSLESQKPPATIKRSIFSSGPNPLQEGLRSVIGEFREMRDKVDTANKNAQYEDDLRASGHRR